MINIFWLIPLVLIFEVIIFLKIASSLGSLNTIILAISTTVIAALILRGTSRKIVERVREIFLFSANPAPQIASEFFKLLAVLLLLLPGFLSDFMGLLLWLLSFNPNMLISLGLSFRFGSSRGNSKSADSEKPEKNGRVIEGAFQDLKDDQKKC